MGGSNQSKQVADLVAQGQQWIKKQTGRLDFDFTNEEQLFEKIFNSIDRLELRGLDLLLGKIFDEIGFGKIKDDIFRQLVIYRIAFPKSKLKTTEYLYRYQHIDWNEDMLYRYMDKLHFTQKQKVQQISYEHTQRVQGNDMHIAFYDVTTLLTSSF